MMNGYPRLRNGSHRNRVRGMYADCGKDVFMAHSCYYGVSYYGSVVIGGGV